MLHQKVMDRVYLFSEDMLLHYSAPNRNLVVEVMQFDAEGLSDLIDEQLSKYIVVLGQYLVMLQYNNNLKTIERALISKSLEFAVNKSKVTEDFPAGSKTDKAKRAWVLANVEEARELDEQLTIADAELTLMSGMNSSVEALLNALKKEKSVRSPSEYHK